MEYISGAKMDVQKLSEIVTKHKNPAGRLLGILEDIQEQDGYLSKETLKSLSQQIQVPLSKLYSLATFYSFFNLQPVGKNIISICMGTACHVKGAPQLLETAMELLKVRPGETTDNGKFILTTEEGCSCSLTTARCFGACSMAPVISVNNKIYGYVTSQQLPKILKEYGWSEQ